eukprot:CAMPEP_0177588932 /NCGR_PEP_ID=MMETSP0419_2-20121207/6510_1 /TAXON_ID=582737 /ORGANISM="Tetraselmis sp., Strain GSL018" /LENGTH=352 /DNA_ID=CAMNT_0019079205 /DNA_START=296 /DNA_END=1354 /DNA_ORIENTATION=+
MIMLLDHIKRKTIPPEMKIRMIFPTNGLQSCSYWDVQDPEQLKAWLDEYLGEDCINSISEVQEDFAWGIAATLNTARGAEAVSARTAMAAKSFSERAQKVSGAASSKFSELDERYKISDHAARTYNNARERTAGATKAIGSMTDRALQNERLAKTVSGVGTVSSAAWKRVGIGFGYLKNKFGEFSETVSASVQEYNSSETLHGGSSSGVNVPSQDEATTEHHEAETATPSPPLEPAFAGFDDPPAEDMQSPQLAVTASEVELQASEGKATPSGAEAAYTIDEDEDEDLGAKDAFQTDAQELPKSFETVSVNDKSAPGQESAAGQAGAPDEQDEDDFISKLEARVSGHEHKSP